MVKAGFAQVSINEGIDFIMGGMFMDYTCDEVHTPLFASAWALEGKDTEVIWVSCDVGVFDEAMALTIRRGVEKGTGVGASNVIVSTTHTHTGPTTCNTSIYNKKSDRSYLERIAARAVEACIEAWSKREPAYMGCGESEVEKCCYNRRYLMKDGKSRMHPGGPDNPERLIKEGPEDRQLQVVWFEDENGIKGVVVNFSSHPSGLFGLRIISADFPGVVRRFIQKIYGDIPVLYLQGCCGNTSPVNHAGDPSWGRGMESCERVGTILGAEVVKIMASTRVNKTYLKDFRFSSGVAKLYYRDIENEQQELSDRIVREHEEGKLKIRVENGNVENVAQLAMANKVLVLNRKKKQSSCCEASITSLSLGNVVFVTNPAELFVEYQLNMKKLINAGHVVVASITNGWCNYVPTKHGFLFKGYEVDQGWFDWQAGQTIEDESVRLANSIVEGGETT